MDKRVPSPWSQFALFLGLGGGMLVLFALLATVIYKVTGLGDQPGSGLLLNSTYSIDIGKVVQVLFSVTVFGLTGYLYSRLTFRERPGYHLGLRPAVRNSFYLLAVLLLVFSLPLEEWLGVLNKRIPLLHWMVETEKDNDRQVEAFIKVHHRFDPVVNVLVMAAIPAFCEEICFRGALQRIMIQICERPLPGILVAAVLFSALHFQFEGFLPRMFLGILLGAAYWYSGSLWVAIIAHFFFNAVQIVYAMAVGSAVSGPDSVKNPAMPVLSVLLSLVIVVGLLNWMRKRSNHGVEPISL